MGTRRHTLHGLRQRLERAAELYLRSCYERRTAARADEFAEHLRRSRSYLSRIVPETLGVSLRVFLRERQLVYARHLLATTNRSTVVIGQAAGFGTHPTFYRCFKKAFGMTPGEYRKQVTK